MMSRSAEIAHKNEVIEDLNQQLEDESSRTRVLQDQFSSLERKYQLAESNLQGDGTGKLIEENESLRKKIEAEREQRKFFQTKFEDMQRLYQESLENVSVFHVSFRGC